MVAGPLIFQVAMIAIQAIDEGHVLGGKVEIDRRQIFEDSGSVGRLWYDGQSSHSLESMRTIVKRLLRFFFSFFEEKKP